MAGKEDSLFIGEVFWGLRQTELTSVVHAGPVCTLLFELADLCPLHNVGISIMCVSFECVIVALAAPLIHTLIFSLRR